MQYYGIEWAFTHSNWHGIWKICNSIPLSIALLVFFHLPVWILRAQKD